MAEAMSEEQLAEIRAIADRDRWSTYCGCSGPRAMVTDLLDEVDRLRAQLAEIGETREEWYVRWPTAGGRYTYELCEDEQDAREAIPDDDDTCEIVKRFVGGWQQVER